MKLLFLDIDGVLNNYRSDLVLGYDKTVDNLDPIAVMLIQKIVKETDCIICLSSNWRYTHNYMELGKELDLPILFETKHNDSEDEDRVKEVSEVLDGLKPDSYAILDDEEDRHEFDGMNFVNVAEEEGVSYKDYLLLLEYLK